MRIQSWARGPNWVRALPAPLIDGLIAGVFVAAVAVDRIRTPLDDTADTVLSVVLSAAMAVSLLYRRRCPLTAFVIGTSVVAAESVFGVATAVSPYAGQVLVYSAGLYCTRSRAWWVPPWIVVGVVVYFSGSSNPAGAEPIGVLVVWLATWAIAYSQARRREEQERSRVAIRRQVAAEEQARMARELHDLIGHTVNLLVVQAGAARVMLDAQPATTRALLLGMEETGRDALADLDQVLSTLRADPRPGGAGVPGTGLAAADAETRRPPGLNGVPDLVSRLNDSQVDVTLSIDPALELPGNIDLSAYRIVQEALTNVLKHAAPCAAQVDIHRATTGLVIEVSDDGPGASTLRGSGRGLIGITERVAACGGSIEYGPGAAGGFRLRAVLPLP